MAISPTPNGKTQATVKYKDAAKTRKFIKLPSLRKLEAQCQSLGKLYLPLSNASTDIIGQADNATGKKSGTISDALRAYADTEQSAYHAAPQGKSRNHALTTKGSSQSNTVSASHNKNQFGTVQHSTGVDLANRLLRNTTVNPRPQHSFRNITSQSLKRLGNFI